MGRGMKWKEERGKGNGEEGESREREWREK